jgi:hypothetical protein
MTVIKKNPYLQTVLLDILATLPELDHADAITARYADSNLSPGASKPATYGRLSVVQNQPPRSGSYIVQFNTPLW